MFHSNSAGQQLIQEVRQVYLRVGVVDILRSLSFQANACVIVDVV